MALAEITIIPVGTPTPSIGDWIAESVRILEKESVKYDIGPMGTMVEGKSSDIFRIAGKMHRAALKIGIERVFTSILIDDRRDKEVTMKSKVASVKKRLRKSFK